MRHRALRHLSRAVDQASGALECVGGIVNASYTGVVPDTFKNGAEVVLKGQLHGQSFAVESNGVMAKCPSKYEVKDSPLAGKSGI